MQFKAEAAEFEACNCSFYCHSLFTAIRHVRCSLHLVNEKALLYTSYTVRGSTKHIQCNGPPEQFGAEAASVCTTCVQALPHKSPSKEQERESDFT